MNRGTSPDASPSRAPALLLGFLAGAVGGLAGGMLLVSSASFGHGSGAAAPVADRATLDAVAALTQELENLRAELSRPDRVTLAPAPLLPADAGAATAEGSDAAVARLSALLTERLATDATAGRADTDRAPLVAETLDDRTRSAAVAERLAALAADLAADEGNRVQHQYFLWTERQVIDRFGRPDAIYWRDDGTVHWNYEDADRFNFAFVFHDGLVVGCW